MRPDEWGRLLALGHQPGTEPDGIPIRHFLSRFASRNITEVTPDGRRLTRGPEVPYDHVTPEGTDAREPLSKEVR